MMFINRARELLAVFLVGAGLGVAGLTAFVGCERGDDAGYWEAVSRLCEVNGGAWAWRNVMHQERGGVCFGSDEKAVKR